MARRPMCLVCLVMIVGIWLWKVLGNPCDSPLPREIAGEIADAGSVTVCGTLQCQAAGENTNSVYLSNTYLMFQSKQYSIQNVRVFFKKEYPITAGSRVKIQGVLYSVPEKRNPGGFDAKSYYAARKIYYWMNGEKVLEAVPGRNPVPALLEKLSDRLNEVLFQVAEGDGGIYPAMLLGEKRLLEPETKDSYQMAGMLHLLAISGLHLTFFGMGCVKLLMAVGVGIKGAHVLAGLLVWFYGMLIPGGPSSMRAILMFTIMAAARCLGRTYDMLSAFALSAVLLLWDNSDYLFYSGFLLSFGAVLGIGMAGEWETSGSPRKKDGRFGKVLNPLWEKLLGNMRTSLSIQLVTLPLVLSFYYEVSLFGIFWNLLILPTAGAVLSFGVLGLAGGLFYVPLGKLLILPGKWLLHLYLAGAKAGALLPYCTWVAGEPEIGKAAVYYLVLALLFLMWKKPRARGVLGMALLGCIVLFGVHPRKGLEITCLDVGQGDGIVWKMPEGENYLVDNGSSSQKQVGRYQLIPYLKSQGIRRLDGIFVTHTDDDHISGILELMEAQRQHTTSIRVKRLYLPRWEVENEAYLRLQEAAGEADIKVIQLEKGMKMQGKNFSVDVKYPEIWRDGEDINGGSLVLELHYKEFVGLFTGDTGAEQEAAMLEELGDCDFLKVAHHGSKNSTSAEFLAKTCPEYAFISCSEKNRYGHPAKETLKRLQTAGCRCLATKDCGALTLWTDGEKIRICGFLALRPGRIVLP